MENTNTVNNVNISLSDYNTLKSNFDASRDLLTKATTELSVLRNQKTDNKLLIIERRQSDNWGGTRIVENLELNIKDPEVSKTLLDVISKVETSELSKKIEDKEEELKRLKSDFEETRLQYEVAERAQRRELKAIEDSNRDLTRKLKKGYEETILELEIDKETLQKALKDLKVNKTQEQLEVAREEELSALKNEISALNSFKSEVDCYTDGTLKGMLKARKFVNDFNNARKFRTDRPWVRNLWANTMTALERVQSFANVMKSVGKIEKPAVSKTVSEINDCIQAATYGRRGYSYTTVNPY